MPSGYGASPYSGIFSNGGVFNVGTHGGMRADLSRKMARQFKNDEEMLETLKTIEKTLKDDSLKETTGEKSNNRGNQSDEPFFNEKRTDDWHSKYLKFLDKKFTTLIDAVKDSSAGAGGGGFGFGPDLAYPGERRPPGRFVRGLRRAARVGMGLTLGGLALDYIGDRAAQMKNAPLAGDPNASITQRVVGSRLGNYAAGTLAGAAMGAQVGMLAGPWGAAIGGGLGAIGGLAYTTYKDESWHMPTSKQVGSLINGSVDKIAAGMNATGHFAKRAAKEVRDTFTMYTSEFKKTAKKHLKEWVDKGFKWDHEHFNSIGSSVLKTIKEKTTSWAESIKRFYTESVEGKSASEMYDSAKSKIWGAIKSGGDKLAEWYHDVMDKDGLLDETKKYIGDKSDSGLKAFGKFFSDTFDSLTDKLSKFDLGAFINDSIQTIKDIFNKAKDVLTAKPKDPSYEQSNPGIQRESGEAFNPKFVRRAGYNGPGSGDYVTGNRIGDFLSGAAYLESSFDKNNKNPNSTASGMFQWTEKSWATMLRNHPELVKAGVGMGDRFDRAKAAFVTATEGNENAQALEKYLGRSVSAADLYMTHLLGLGGGERFLKNSASNPNAIAANDFSSVAGSNSSIFYDKNNQPRTYADIQQYIESKIRAGSEAVMQHYRQHQKEKALEQHNEVVPKERKEQKASKAEPTVITASNSAPSMNQIPMYIADNGLAYVNLGGFS